MAIDVSIKFIFFIKKGSIFCVKEEQREEILQGHDRLETGPRKFGGNVTIGYVTPVN
jgi:hypothetical protein